MPTATKDKPETDAAPAKKSSFLKSKKGIIVLLVLLVAAGGAYKFLLAPAPSTKPAKPTGGDFVALTATTLNLQADHYLKVGVAVQLVKGKTAPTDFRNRANQIMIADFSNRTVASLSSNAGRATVMAQMEKDLKTAYPDEIYTLFLTQFVTQ